MPHTLDLRYLFRMTDCTGMFQHAVLGVPDPSEGYTTDDNARALILAVMLYEDSSQKEYEELIIRYLSFLLYAEKDRWFRNFMDYSRIFTEKRGSEDCFGRCLLALGFTTSRKRLPASVRGCAEKLLRRTVSSCSSLNCIKSKAYALAGLALWNTEEAQPYIQLLRDSLADTYLQYRRESWCWFEDTVTYCSAILPFAILCAFPAESPEREIGFESLDFLVDTMFHGETFRPVGCRGWLKRGSSPAVYDEQPVEACGMMLACIKAYALTENADYLQRAKHCFYWYLGENIAQIPLIDPETGGCFDGLTADGINNNEGAESILSWLIAALTAKRNHWFPKEKAPEAQHAPVVWL